MLTGEPKRESTLFGAFFLRLASVRIHSYFILTLKMSIVVITVLKVILHKNKSNGPIFKRTRILNPNKLIYSSDFFFFETTVEAKL